MRGSLHGAGCNPWRIKQQNGTHRPDPRHPSRGWARVSTAAPAGGQRSGGRGRPPGLRGQQARAGPGLHPDLDAFTAPPLGSREAFLPDPGRAPQRPPLSEPSLRGFRGGALASAGHTSPLQPHPQLPCHGGTRPSVDQN